MTTTSRIHARQYTGTISSELDAFLADAEDRRGLSANTIASYRCDLLAVGTVLTGSINLITFGDIESFLAGRNESPSTSNRRVASLRQFFRWVQRQGYRADNPVDLVEAKRDSEKLPRPIKRGDLKALDKAIVAAPQPYRLIFTILRETGMRADEVLNLNVGDVILDRGREGLLVREPKNNRQRLVVLISDAMPRTLTCLRPWLRDLGSDVSPTLPLFCSNRGTRVHYDTLHYHWVELCKTANLVDTVNGTEHHRYTIHQLRHTIASDLIKNYPEQIVSRILGHRDPRSTRRYAEVNEEQVRTALSAHKKRGS
jgi:integrase/recombinase XerD